MRSEKEIQILAADLLRSTGISGPPVDVAAIARKLGAQIRLEKADVGLSGALYRLPNNIVIGVNKEHSLVRRRFTMAHEIGHLVLHDQPVFIDRSFLVASINVNEPLFHRDSLSSQAVDSKEIEANRFAAALLVPQDFLRSDLEGCNFPLLFSSVRDLAKRYNVSSQAMTFRLINLGIPIDQA